MKGGTGGSTGGQTTGTGYRINTETGQGLWGQIICESPVSGGDLLSPACFCETPKYTLTPPFWPGDHKATTNESVLALLPIPDSHV